MGLQGQINDVSSDSIPILLVALVANCVNSLRSFLFGLLQSAGIYRFGPAHVEDGLLGTGLAGLILLAEQLNLNRLSSYRYCCNQDGGLLGNNKCVVCLSMLREGDHVRELSCRHVFHKDCFDGWLDHLNFNCPLCRFPLVSDERVSATRRRVGEDLVAWFPIS